MKYFLFVISILIFSTQKNYAQTYDTEKDLEILSWNIHMLPFLIYHKTKKMERAKEIAAELNNTSIDIVIFQEAFHRRARKKIWKRLKDKYPFKYGPANRKRPISFKANSGIWILSNRPLLYLDEIKYDECTGDGCLARKGALMMEGEHNGNRFQLLGTHNNGGAINNSQFHQIRSELLDVYYKENVPQFICGDFNTKTSSPNQQWETMTSLFDANLSYTQYDDRDSTHKAAWAVEDIYARWPDFIFVRENQNSLLNIKRIATVSYGITWQQGNKKIYGETVGLSDHYPVWIKMNWDE